MDRTADTSESTPGRLLTETNSEDVSISTKTSDPDTKGQSDDEFLDLRLVSFSFHAESSQTA